MNRPGHSVAYLFAATIILLQIGSHSGLAAELNPFFKPIEPSPPPILATIQHQITQGCVSNNQGKRPLADRYDLRHGLTQVRNADLSRTAASVSIADPPYEQARQWLRLLLAHADPRVAYAAHAVLLSHGVRRMAAREETTGIVGDLNNAERLAARTGANTSDLLFWRALVGVQQNPSAESLRLVRDAIRADPWFYNARLLELELLLRHSRRHAPFSGTHCREQAVDILKTAVALFDLDTCPRHAVLLLNWLRAGQRNVSGDPFAQLVRAYVAVLLNNRPAFHEARKRIADTSHSPCRQPILEKMRTLASLFDKQSVAEKP
uniref:Uncharacterized protein n=1 Tax=Candidatus Kentrum sp. DK TaxID=2126562 RepID=A0A450RVX1_9GAMM|nr:MAG: hypothetical protein BECKDK2373B_GA0170837_100511 [Candidatus Kentron sp. DK]